MESSVQVAIVGGMFSLGGYAIGAFQKTVERFLGQRHFQNNALEILKGLAKDMNDLEKSITDLNRGMQSQRAIMRQLLDYSKQHADAAVQMSKIVEEFIHNTKDDKDEETDDDL